MKSIFKCFYIEKTLECIHNYESSCYVVTDSFANVEEIMKKNPNFHSLSRIEILGKAIE